MNSVGCYYLSECPYCYCFLADFPEFPFAEYDSSKEFVDQTSSVISGEESPTEHFMRVLSK